MGMESKWFEISSSQAFANLLIREPDVAQKLSVTEEPLRKFVYEVAPLMPEESWIGMVVFRVDGHVSLSICLLTRKEGFAQVAKSFDAIDTALEDALQDIPHEVYHSAGYAAIRDSVDPRVFLDVLAEKNEGYVMKLVPMAPIQHIIARLDEAAKYDMLPPDVSDTSSLP